MCTVFVRKTLFPRGRYCTRPRTSVSSDRTRAHSGTHASRLSRHTRYGYTCAARLDTRYQLPEFIMRMPDSPTHARTGRHAIMQHAIMHKDNDGAACACSTRHIMPTPQQSPAPRAPPTVLTIQRADRPRKPSHRQGPPHLSPTTATRGVHCHRLPTSHSAATRARLARGRRAAPRNS